MANDSVYKITENDKDKGILQINEEEAEVVRTIFEQHLNEQLPWRIKEHQIDNNIPTKSGKRDGLAYLSKELSPIGNSMKECL